MNINPFSVPLTTCFNLKVYSKTSSLFFPLLLSLSLTLSLSHSLSAEKQREDSEITKIFGGQLRSQLVCPDCAKTTVYFEYHRSVSTDQIRFISSSTIIFSPIICSPSHFLSAFPPFNFLRYLPFPHLSLPSLTFPHLSFPHILFPSSLSLPFSSLSF